MVVGNLKLGARAFIGASGSPDLLVERPRSWEYEADAGTDPPWPGKVILRDVETGRWFIIDALTEC